jgi:autotransporter-associated beta strand protein
MSLFAIQNFSPSAPFIFGDNTSNNILCIMQPSGDVHPMVNNATAPATIAQSIEFQAGGGEGYTMDFSGSGNWVVNNYLIPDNHAFSPSTVQVDGPGTVFWGAGATGRYAPNSVLGNINVTGGALVMTSAFPLNSGQMLNTAISNATSITYSPATSADTTLTNETWNGVISGAGNLIINGGTLTLGGSNIYTGNTILSNGEAIVNAPENPGTSGPLGTNNIISFDGGTLGFSVSNSFDYSPRFDPSPKQAYSIDTAGQSLTFSNALASSGGTLSKLGSGTLALAGTSSYTGATVISAGRLIFQSPKTGSGDVTVADGAALGVFASGTPVSAGTLTVGSSAGATLEFNDVNSTTTPLIAASTISAVGTLTIDVNSGTFTPGRSYPLLAWTNGTLNGASGYLSIVSNVLYLNIPPLAPPKLNFTPNGNNLRLSWTGSFKLQAQTNSLNGTNWADYPGGGTSPVTITIDPANASVFFRLVSVP